MYIKPDLTNPSIAQMLSRLSLYRYNLHRQRPAGHLLVFIILLAISPGAIAQEAGSLPRDPDALYKAGAYREALDIWMLRAFEGDAESQFRAGVVFGEGKGVEQDFEQSSYWFTQAARQGHVSAQYNLGHAYYAGAGIKQSQADALTWWEESARGGHELAQYNMGRAYYMGIGTPKDQEAARFWFSQATANGEPKSREILEKLGWEPVAAVHTRQPVDPDSPVAPLLEQPDLVTPYSDDLSASTPLEIAIGSDNEIRLADISGSAIPAMEEEAEIAAPGEAPVTSTEPPAEADPPGTDYAGTAVTPDAAAGHTAGTQLIVKERPAEERHDDPDMATGGEGGLPPETAGRGEVPVYTAPGSGGLLLGVVAADANWRIINRSGSWVRVTRTPGFPVWVHSNDVTIRNATATIKGNRIPIRAVPVVSESSTLGTVQRGESFDVITEQGEWVRIISPTNIAAWIKEADMGTTVISAASPPGSQSLEWRTVGEPRPAGGRLKDDEQWLFSQSPESFTIQIISLANEQGIIEFVTDQGLGDDAHYFTTVVDDSLLYVLRYGSYASQEAAIVAGSDLPVAGQATWIRNLGSIQQDRCQSLQQVPDSVRTGLAAWCTDN